MSKAQSLHSPLLLDAGFRHAFFTRHGGVSLGPFESLSFSVAAGDDPAHVEENLRRAGEDLEVDPARIYFLSQVHGREVVPIGGSEDRTEVLYARGDAVVSRCPEVACAVRSADCVPVLVADRRTGAAVAIHAGWRGTVARVVAAGVGGLRGDPQDLIAAIGPHISRSAFEVGEEVAAQLEAASSDGRVVDRALGPRPHVDLRRILRSQLRELGLPNGQIDDVAGCTVSEPERFFSFRRDGKRSGRHLSAIVPRGGAAG